MKVRYISKKISSLQIYTFGILLFAVLVYIYCYHLSTLMPFIGDQGWFYLSARNMLLTGKIPLVGITSSHTWLHQGPLWTYILAILLKIGNFNPLFPGYITALTGVVTVFIMYLIGSRLFSRIAGLLAALLYASSPLVIMEARMPYHTSLIPLVVLIYFFALSQWINGKRRGFAASIFLLAVLYNFELATVVLAVPFFVILGYGVYKKTIWLKNISSKKTISLGIVSFLIPLLPVIIYDTKHGYPQTLKFAVWLVYTLLKPVLRHFIKVPLSPPGPNFWQTTLLYIRELLFFPLSWVAVILLTGGICVFLFTVYTQKLYQKTNVLLLLLLFLVTLLSYVATMTPSEAYLPMVTPFLFLALSLGISSLRQKLIRRLLFVAVFLIAVVNIFSLVKSNYALQKEPTFADRVTIVRYIIRKAHGRPYALIAKGPGSEFVSFTMNYEYLLWYLGSPPSHKTQSLRFVISEENRRVTVTSMLQ